MREISVLKKRILEFIESKNITKYDFYRKTGISNGVLSQKTGLSEESIMKFLSYFNDVNIHWLFTGNGQMTTKNTYLIKNNDPNMLNEENEGVIKYLESTIEKKDSEIQELIAENAILKHKNEQ